MAAAGDSALLAKKPDPTDADIDASMAGILCRCGTYQRIRWAIHRAAEATGNRIRRLPIDKDALKKA